MKISLSEKKPAHLVQWEKAQEDLAKRVEEDRKKALKGLSGPEAKMKRESHKRKDQLDMYMGKHKKAVDKDKEK